MTTDLGPATAIDVRDVSGAILGAIEADAGRDSDAGIWAADGDGAVAADAYTPTGAVHVLRARDRSLWRIIVEPVDTIDVDDVTPSVRPLLHDRPAGWYVADGLRLISGPFRTEEAAESERRRVAASRTDPHYRYPNGAPMPIWTPTTYYWHGDAAPGDGN
jgi:hypothetical protein